jgi:glutaredoxin
MSTTIVWSKESCPFCQRAIALLDEKGIDYELRTIGEGWSREQLLESVPHARTVPQIFLEGKLIGGFTELAHHLNKRNQA